MHFKYTLSGSNVVEGDEAEKMFNIVRFHGIKASNFWIYWNESEESAKITVTLQSISAKFEIAGASSGYLKSVVSYYTATMDDCSIETTKEIYLLMREQAENAESELTAAEIEDAARAERIKIKNG